eukprot:2798347-Amphidinium_carterae.1
MKNREQPGGFGDKKYKVIKSRNLERLTQKQFALNGVFLRLTARRVSHEINNLSKGTHLTNS